MQSHGFAMILGVCKSPICFLNQQQNPTIHCCWPSPLLLGIRKHLLQTKLDWRDHWSFPPEKVKNGCQHIGWPETEKSVGQELFWRLETTNVRRPNWKVKGWYGNQYPLRICCQLTLTAWKMWLWRDARTMGRMSVGEITLVFLGALWHFPTYDNWTGFSGACQLTVRYSGVVRSTGESRSECHPANVLLELNWRNQADHRWHQPGSHPKQVELKKEWTRCQIWGIA